MLLVKTDSENESFDDHIEVDFEGDCLSESSSDLVQYNDLPQAYAFQPEYTEEELQHLDRASTSEDEQKKFSITRCGKIDW